VGVLQRFERRLEGLVEGTFARVFGGAVQPVEVAAALQREAQDRKAVVGRGRVLVPNDYVVELGRSDSERLAAYDKPLRKELAAMLSEHAQEQGWSFVGPVAVRFEQVEGIATGVFRVRSAVTAVDDSRENRVVRGDGTGPRLVLESAGTERVVPLSAAVTVLGRGAEADLRLPDTGVSRAHAEVRLDDGVATLVDLRSTNGTTVNGRRVTSAPLRDGDRIGIGAVALVYRGEG
jgi:Protein of unknown function (DUF3662)/FHA domain